MNILENDEILGEKTSDIEEVIRQIINVQNDDEALNLNEKDVLNVSKLVQTIRDNPHLLKFIKQKYIENLGAWLVQNASNILNEPYQKFSRDKDGNVILDDKTLLSREHHGQGKMADKWFIIDDKEFLAKDLFTENITENTLIAEEIARQLNLPVAVYFPAKEKDKRKILTLNFLKPNEILVEGNKICKKEMDIIKVEEQLKEFLEKEQKGKNKYKVTEIDNESSNTEKIITNYKKFILYSILINHRDAHNGNWAVIKNAESEQYAFSRIYDLEGALCENIYKIRAFSCNDKFDDDLVLDYILDDKEVLKLAQKIDYLNMDNVYKKVYERKRVQVSKELREKNNIVIQEQKQIIRAKVLNRIRNNTKKAQEI